MASYARRSGRPPSPVDRGDYQALLRPRFCLSFWSNRGILFETSMNFTATAGDASQRVQQARVGPRASGPYAQDIRVIGMTSEANQVVQSLGCYDAVVTYDSRDVAAIGLSHRVFVGHDGNSYLRARCTGISAER